MQAGGTVIASFFIVLQSFHYMVQIPEYCPLRWATGILGNRLDLRPRCTALPPHATTLTTPPRHGILLALCRKFSQTRFAAHRDIFCLRYARAATCALRCRQPRSTTTPPATWRRPHCLYYAAGLLSITHLPQLQRHHLHRHTAAISLHRTFRAHTAALPHHARRR